MFASPAYRRLWAARTVSQWGDVFATVTLALLVLRLTGSALGVTGVVLAEIVPVLLLAPLAGTLVDRRPRVRVMVGADLFRAAPAADLPLLEGHVSAVYAVAFGLAAGNVLFNPAAGSALPTLVDDAQLVPANSGIWTAAVLSQIALAPLAGLTFVAFGPGCCGVGEHRRPPALPGQPPGTPDQLLAAHRGGTVFFEVQSAQRS